MQEPMTIREITSRTGDIIFHRYVMAGEPRSVTSAIMHYFNEQLQADGRKPLSRSTKTIEHAAWWLNASKKPFLLICGPVGTGKTTLANAIVKAINHTPWKNCVWRGNDEKIHGQLRGIGKLETKTDNDLLRMQSATDIARLATLENYAMFTDCCRVQRIAIDDIGCEPVDVSRYGNVTSPMAELVDKRSKNRLFTIFTSNLNLQDLGLRYGERTLSRLVEVTEVIEMLGKDFRRL